MPPENKYHYTIHNYFNTNSISKLATLNRICLNLCLSKQDKISTLILIFNNNKII